MSSSRKKLSCVSKSEFYIIDLGRQKVKACCRSPFSSKTSSLDEDLRAIIEDRKLLNSGIQAESCGACWELEKEGHKSFRTSVPHDPSQNLSETAHEPFFVQFDVSNICNLKCVYCGPEQSSKWAKQFNLKPAKYSLTPEIKQLIKKLWDQAGRFHIVGGEPAIAPEVFELLDFLSELHSEFPGTRKKHLFIVSNLATSPKIFKTFIDKLLPIADSFEIDIAVSTETIGNEFEYIRDGADFSVFDANLDYLYETKKFCVSFMSTFNLLSMKTYPLALKYYLDKSIKHRTPLQLIYNEVVFPSHLSPRIYPHRLEDEHQSILKMLDSFPIELIRSQRYFDQFRKEVSQLYDSLKSAPLKAHVIESLDQGERMRLNSKEWRHLFADLIVA